MSQDIPEFWNYWPRKSSLASSRGWLGAVWFGVPVELAQRSSEVARRVGGDRRPLIGVMAFENSGGDYAPAI